MYKNNVLGEYEQGLLLGHSMLQFGDEFEANASEVKNALTNEWVVLV
jgi:hypothetical protein